MALPAYPVPPKMAIVANGASSRKCVILQENRALRLGLQ
jgi:hypothetical protein